MNQWILCARDYSYFETKGVQNPAMRWVFFLLRGITEAAIRLGGTSERGLTNMTEELWGILSLMGDECEKYYV